jgi:hypothetical protein
MLIVNLFFLSIASFRHIAFRQAMTFLSSPPSSRGFASQRDRFVALLQLLPVSAVPVLAHSVVYL